MNLLPRLLNSVQLSRRLPAGALTMRQPAPAWSPVGEINLTDPAKILERAWGALVNSESGGKSREGVLKIGWCPLCIFIHMSFIRTHYKRQLKAARKKVTQANLVPFQFKLYVVCIAYFKNLFYFSNFICAVIFLTSVCVREEREKGRRKKGIRGRGINMISNYNQLLFLI